MTLSQQDTDWRGTVTEALERVGALIQTFELGLTLPTERAVRDWRAEGLLTVSGRHFTARNVIEILRVRQLRDQGLPVAVIKDALDGLTDAQLYDAAVRPVPEAAATQDDDRASHALILLAHGILRQFEAVREGHIVGEYATIPIELRQAQAHLARLALLEGGEDTFASVHALLKVCTFPLSMWAPRVIADRPEYADLVLIDGEYRVPSEDCGLLAEQGGHLEDLVETGLHRRLGIALAGLPHDERPAAYTLVRQFIAEHPLATRDELREIRLNPCLNSDVVTFLESAYTPVHADEARHGEVARCARCSAQLGRNGHCRLVTCRAMHPEPLAGPPVLLADAHVARPELLKYWCDPAQEELRLYRALEKVHGSRAELYPLEDACDVSLGQDVGVDVKDYRDPARLARKLNASLGGLRRYPRMILAVAARRARSESYLPRLREHLLPGVRAALEVMSVDQAITALTKKGVVRG